ncbi:protein FAM135B-like isoform X1 [Punica granatum]|uniref:Protein FAM135B-like isoform X1 n=1 Tax=Punica granatum TaxID=22663 RepID=A0A6P8C8J7_PUNGR|nr:protein FAM135B-like isoform X1 [Punica granatum]XP_031377377.1 protein FAM135B-like isoform X1 [Punica granatum]XP_031377378.1 protein FAM135B-like isoform X1 [Punica granatum]XP_031377379.1 protein FAM135B-like isoform X1 [Punica granatum]
MIRRFGWFIGLNNKTSSAKRLPDAKPHPAKVKPVAIMDTMQEIAIYVHRFHNLDLFQQGWYQLKITMRWEDAQNSSPGTPARVVQYEAPDLGPDDILGFWRIDDTDNSFSTQPFRIKYARQDVLLSVMVSFNLSLGKFEGSSTSAVILKFELMYAPISETGSAVQTSLDACSAAVHEFRIPPKALLGLHSYCPVHFDAFHAVLVDTTVHISLLKAGPHVSPPKVPSGSHDVEIGERFAGLGLALDQLASEDKKHVAMLRTLVAARDILLEELRNLSKAIDRAIDFSEIDSEIDDKKLSDLKANLDAVDDQASGPGKPQNGVEIANHSMDFSDDGLFRSLSRDSLMCFFHLLGNQVLYLWNTFLKFHRANKTSILDYLRDAWAIDRRAEWSIWMVYTKVEMPHHYISSGSDESSHHRRVSSLWKMDDPAHSAAMRAELHRRSIAQMRINNRSIQDLHIFGDPSHVPIVIVERVINAPRRTVSVNSYFSHFDFKDSASLLSGSSFETSKRQSGGGLQQNGRTLKVVVFVHGFQGHHLDLRLVRNQWLLIDPKIEFLMSEVNEEKTSGDFREMGQRLAQEVIAFLKKKMDKITRTGSLRNIKLSFVGHSIGNIIIRTALAEGIMEPYLRYLYTYISISGPHLGYLYSSNSLFNSGLWLLKKLKGTQCIHQLTFTDDPDLRNTFFYKLCKHKTLENFRNIVLLSSPQDGYVPYHSARIEFCPASATDHSKKGKVFLEMLNDCLDQIRAQSSEHRVFMRCDVNFDSSLHGRNLNTFIGRAAHIEFLESDIFARFIMWSFPELFR